MLTTSGNSRKLCETGEPIESSEKCVELVNKIKTLNQVGILNWKLVKKVTPYTSRNQLIGTSDMEGVEQVKNLDVLGIGQQKLVFLWQTWRCH